MHFTEERGLADPNMAFMAQCSHAKQGSDKNYYNKGRQGEFMSKGCGFPQIGQQQREDDRILGEKPKFDRQEKIDHAFKQGCGKGIVCQSCGKSNHSTLGY